MARPVRIEEVIEGDVVENFHFIRNRLTAMTDSQGNTSSFAPNNTVISTGQTAGDPLVRATFGSAFTLDGVGNRAQTDLNEPMMLSYNHETTNYTYSLGNILDTAAGGGSLANGNTYTHDANGNRTSKTNGTNVTSYTYDSLNRLTQTSTTGRTIQYIYNGLGQRTGEIDNGVQINYLIDPNRILPQVLAETDAGNNLIAYYVYDGVGLVAQITPDNQYYFYHYDGLGSTIAITDNAGQVVNTYAYSPEGLVGTEETIPNSFTYIGRFGVMAEGNGLYFMRARYYDPEVGRFINKDPIGYVGELNLYGYTENNLINAIDPLGLFIIIVIENGTKESPLFGATIIVIGQNGQSVTVSGSSWPSPTNPNPGIASGSYPGVYSSKMLHQLDPGILLNNGGQIPTLFPNPNQGDQYFSENIELHASLTDFQRGSRGCITIKRSEAQKVWNILKPGETGNVIVIRIPYGPIF